MAFSYLCCQPLLQGGQSQPASLLVLAPVLQVVDPWFGLRLFQVLVVGLLGGLFVVFLGDVGQHSHFCAGVVARGKLAAMHLQTEPYHFTIVTYLHQPSPLPSVAVLNRSSYSIFETLTGVDKLVLVHSDILASSLH